MTCFFHSCYFSGARAGAWIQVYLNHGDLVHGELMIQLSYQIQWYFFFFFIQQEAKMFLIETVQISNPAAVTLLKHQRRSSFQMVNSILAFTISLLLFFRAGTTFALNTFACGMTSSMPFTSTSTTSVSTTSFSSLPSCTLHSLLGVCVFSGMVETASPWTFHSQQLLTVLAEIKPQSWLKKKKKKKNLCQYLMLTITSVDWNKVEVYLLTLTFNVCMFLIVTW